MRLPILIAISTLGLALPTLRAGLPLPDHILYGTLAISNHIASSSVVVQAQRAANAPVLASYTMSSISRLDKYYYELRFQLEDSAPSSPRVVLPGEQLLVTVSDGSGLKYQTTYLVGDPGTAVRQNFGASLDTNGDGVPEAWELENFGVLTPDLSQDSDGDGISDRDEYVAGTNPNDAGDVFRLTVQSTSAATLVSFLAVGPKGPGYDGRVRYYALESSSDVAGARWLPLPNLSRVVGNDQKVEYVQTVGGTNAPTFFRARVWLEVP